MISYRARSSTVWGWVAVAVGAAVATLDLAGSGPGGATAGLGLGAAAVATGVAAFLRPHVAVAEDHVQVHNVLATTTVPFARLARIETRWTLELVGDDGRRTGSFAAPAPGAAQAHRARKDAALTGDEEARYGSAGELPGTPSGDAAAMVRARWEAWRDAHTASAGDPSDVEGPSSVRRPDPVGIALTVAAVAAAAWGLLS